MAVWRSLALQSRETCAQSQQCTIRLAHVRSPCPPLVTHHCAHPPCPALQQGPDQAGAAAAVCVHQQEWAGCHGCQGGLLLSGGWLLQQGGAHCSPKREADEGMKAWCKGGLHQGLGLVAAAFVPAALASSRLAHPPHSRPPTTQGRRAAACSGLHCCPAFQMLKHS